MKNKKLFAILTLVCFMFTLMPVAAFAADEFYADQVYVGASYEEEAEVTVKAPFNVGVGATTTVSAANYVFYAVDEDGDGVALSTAVGATTLTINAIGEYKVYAIDVTSQDVDDVLTAVDTVANKVAKLAAWAEALDLIVDGEAEVSVVAPDMEYQIVLKPYTKDGYTSTVVAGTTATLNIEASNGFEKDGKVIAELQSRVKDSGRAFEAVKAGYDLKITEAGYVDVAYDTLTTDRKGQVVFEVTTNLANDGNKVIVKFGKAKAELTVDAATTGFKNVALENAPKAPTNNENPVVAADVEFKFTDANGVAANVVLVPRTNIVDLDASNIAITIVEKPANSTLKASDFALAKMPAFASFEADETGVYTLMCTKGDGTVDKDGTYTIKVALKNGSSATATFKVAEMGDVVRIMFKDAPKTIAYGEYDVVGDVIAMDANGVAEVVEVELSANGIAVDEFYAEATCDACEVCDDSEHEGYIAKGTVVVENDDDYIGKTITVMAVYNDEFIATTEIAVVDKAATVALVSNEAEVGINTTLEAKIVDANGAKTSIGALADVKVIVLDKPENAVAVATAGVAPFAVNADGNVEFNFLASAAGEYKVQVVVVTADSKYVSGIVTVVAGGGKTVFNDVVVMSIGANNIVVNSEVKAIAAAPMIQDGRTFVPFRALAEAFGAEVAWEEATQSVVAELNGVKVVMVIGANEYTVNGAAKTADVAPFINGASTMVPVRFVAEAFGINVTPIYAENGAVADVLFAK